MSIVKPFKGLRPKPALAKEIASPPYDVLSVAEAKEIVKNNPKSFLRINKAELEFDNSIISTSEHVYQRSRNNLQSFIDDGFLFQDESECFYVYRLTQNHQSQTGLVALTSIDEYDAGLIKKHEHTRPDKVLDRASHISILNAQVGPVFSIFRHEDTIIQLLQSITENNSTVDFLADDGVRHELWVVKDDKTINQIVNAFENLSCMYIADGHHRSQSASEVCSQRKEKNPYHNGSENYNYFLNVIFPDSEVNILPYNRVVKDLNNHTLQSIIDLASEKFEIRKSESAINPQESNIFGMYCQGEWHYLKSKIDSFDSHHPTQSIDAAILANNFLNPILSILDPKTDKRINFVGGIRGVEELVKLIDSGQFEIAFSLYHISIQQLLSVADANEVMPPKSTWFEPKLRSGMVVNLLND